MAEIWPDEGLDQLLGMFPKSGSLPANTWMGLFTAFTQSTVGTNNQTRASYTEPGAGVNYARQTISSASWGSAAGVTGGRKSTASQVTFSTASGSWGTVNGFFVANSLTSGSLYFAANFDDVTAVAISSGDVIKVTPYVTYGQ